MARLVKAGTAEPPVKLQDITSSNSRGSEGLFTVQSTSAVPSGETIQLQISCDAGTTWSDLPTGILDENADVVNVVVSTMAFIKADLSGAATYSGTVNII